MLPSVRGVILSGTDLSKEIRKSLASRVDSLKSKLANYTPALAIVQVGGREDSNVYIRMKIKAASEIGINATHIKLPQTTTERELLNQLSKLNNDPNTHGIIVQMPLDSVSKINSHLITDSVIPEKDVDGLNTINEGKIAIGDMTGFLPCTPNGCIELIKQSGVPISGARAVVLGRSKIVGTPVAELLKWHNATVTVCHSRTINLPEIVSEADILVVGIGQPKLVKGSWIKPGAVVIDCGINAIPDPTKKSGQRLVGDVDYEEAVKVASYITPVPGGVGPMTVAMLMQNTVISAERAIEKLLNTKWNIQVLQIHPMKPVPNDDAISGSLEPKSITSLAEEIGLFPSEFRPYGSKMAKVGLNVLNRLKDQANGKLVVVVGITPTVLGEGKSTTALGLVQALTAHKGINSLVTLRQHSQARIFKAVGSSTSGGGYSQVIPMEEFRLHLTGDIHAVTAANNLLAAQIDTRYFHESTQTDQALYNRLVPTVKGVRNFSKIQLKRLQKLGITKTDPNSLTEEERRKFARLNIDPQNITWTRAIDTTDRFLRKLTIGQSPTEKGKERETSFCISVGSEIMAILALSKSVEDMKERLGKTVVGFNNDGIPLTAEDFGATNAMAILLKDAIEPTLMQTLEGTPVLVHTGPFPNIAHGCSSIIADSIGLKLVGSEGIVVTETGCGSDIGMEKFFDIKCRTSDHVPNAIVLVATVRALKMHGGGSPIKSGTSLQKEYLEERLDLVEKGLPNLEKHISNGIKFGLPVVVAINVYATDTEAELQLVRNAALATGASAAVICHHWAEGGAGALELADAVIEATKGSSNFKFLYNLETNIEEKISIIAREMYGAGQVVVTKTVRQKIRKYNELGYDKLPLCIAKTPYSLTGDASIKGAPVGFTLIIKDILVSVGAGFIIPVVGDIILMPGLSVRPNIYDMDWNCETNEIEGLF